jgi:hypothetical protein
LLPSLGRL